MELYCKETGPSAQPAYADQDANPICLYLALIYVNLSTAFLKRYTGMKCFEGYEPDTGK